MAAAASGSQFLAACPQGWFHCWCGLLYVARLAPLSGGVFALSCELTEAAMKWCGVVYRHNKDSLCVAHVDLPRPGGTATMNCLCGTTCPLWRGCYVGPDTTCAAGRGGASVPACCMQEELVACKSSSLVTGFATHSVKVKGDRNVIRRVCRGQQAELHHGMFV